MPTLPPGGLPCLCGYAKAGIIGAVAFALGAMVLAFCLTFYGCSYLPAPPQ